MKNKARPLSVDRLKIDKTNLYHYIFGYRGFYNRFIKYNLFSNKTMNQLNEDCN